VQAAHLIAQPPNGRDGLGLRLFCHAFIDAYKNWNYDWRSNGEQWLLNRLAAFHPAVIFDVGANVGSWLAIARGALPGARFHAFEIVEATFAELRKSMADHADVEINNFGLSDHNGSIQMHLFDSSNTLTSHVPYPHGSYSKLVCPVKRGDTYMQDKGIERIDILKIDVEGAEHLVLEGFGAAISTGQIEVVQFEYGRLNIITHFLLRDFYEFLESKGYVIGKLFPNHVDFRAYALEDEDFLGPNYIAVYKARSDIVDALRKR
jgi:FkbM family methyltransferase